ncbi:MAG TPA: carbon starvation CstA 5TM domain-containing protein, partial [Longimicrobium sp.]
ISNQLLASVALCVGTTVLIKSGKARHAWTTLLPLAWLVIVTFTAGLQKVFAADPRLGFLSHAASVQAKLAAGQLPTGAKTLADAQRMIFNDRLDAGVALAFMAVAVLVMVVSIREWTLILSRRKPGIMHEAPFVPTAIAVAGD